MIYGYIRVSSDKQTVENQRFEINNFCERYKLISMVGFAFSRIGLL
jgi:DNA invertase Pin-like site-specific DNA recombinase